jgi:hypothetical protein
MSIPDLPVSVPDTAGVDAVPFVLAGDPPVGLFGSTPWNDADPLSEPGFAPDSVTATVFAPAAGFTRPQISAVIGNVANTDLPRNVIPTELYVTAVPVIVADPIITSTVK